MTILLDRLLSRLLRGVIILLITVAAGAALFLLYSGLIALCSGRFSPAVAMLGASAIASAACYGLCRHGNDLMDR